MSRQFADNAQRPMDEPPPDDRQRELLKEVLAATIGARSPGHGTDDSRYQHIVARWRGTPWGQETIGESLVGVALTDWFHAVQLSQSAQLQLIRDITQALFDDPSSAARLENWWIELQESNE